MLGRVWPLHSRLVAFAASHTRNSGLKHGAQIKNGKKKYFLWTGLKTFFFVETEKKRKMTCFLLVLECFYEFFTAKFCSYPMNEAKYL